MAPRSTSLIWNYYVKENSDLAKCKSCSKKLLTKSSNTKGLWVHLKSIHPVDNIELDKLVAEQKILKGKDILLEEKKYSQQSFISTHLKRSFCFFSL